MKTISRWFLVGLGGCVLFASASGCIVKTDDADRFREALPKGEDVALSVPHGSSASTRALHTKGGTPGGLAKYYQFTRDVADGVDAGTASVLGLVWLIVHSPPTSISSKHAVWGPGNGNALDPVVWRMTVDEVGSQEYDYHLDARPKASTSEGDYKVILQGHGWGVLHPNHRKGWFKIDFEAHRSLDPARSKDGGAVKVDFDARAYPITISADMQPFPDDRTKGWATIVVTHQKDAGGAVDITGLVDLDLKDGKLEDVTLHSRWNLTGAGRADVQITGGSTTTKVSASECWSSAFTRVYYSDTTSSEPTMGSSSSCAFEAASF